MVPGSSGGPTFCGRGVRRVSFVHDVEYAVYSLALLGFADARIMLAHPFGVTYQRTSDHFI